MYFEISEENKNKRKKLKSVENNAKMGSQCYITEALWE
jgi:hypothetical protein